MGPGWLAGVCILTGSFYRVYSDYASNAGPPTAAQRPFARGGVLESAARSTCGSVHCKARVLWSSNVMIYKLCLVSSVLFIFLCSGWKQLIVAAILSVPIDWSTLRYILVSTIGPFLVFSKA